MRRNSFAALIILLALSACATPETLTLQPQTFADLAGWNTANHNSALSAFRQSCTVMMKRPPDAALGPQMGQVHDWQPACEAAEKLHKGNARAFFEEHFSPFKSVSNLRPDGLFTGYYEIELKGSLKKTKHFKYPIYRMPPEIARGFTRAAIDAGALQGKGLELVWVDDPVQLFFLHIQGSGIVRLTNGKKIRIGYDGQNGQPYVSLGRWLIDNNYMAQEDVDAPAIKRLLRQNPELAQNAMEQNPSYVYFKRRDDLSRAQGPIGAQTVPLTSYCSLAVDKRFYGYGIPMWVETDLPNGKPFHKLAISQDTGGAIRGAIRADIFYGHGKTAETLAGYMNQRGSLWILLPKELAARYVEK